ncbi:MAG: hypothetical protein H6729_07620 [Deltaproteobacteria bacterium]|nr:hypothetical protein [Deltaproteobacteria bacterium]
MNAIDTTWFAQHLRGREGLVDLTVVDASIDRVRSAVRGMATQPMLSALSLRAEAVWQQALEALQHAFALNPPSGACDLSPMASAALIDTLCDDEEKASSLEVHPSFSGPHLATFAFGPVLKAALAKWVPATEIGWTPEFLGVRMAPPYCVLVIAPEQREHLVQLGGRSGSPLDVSAIAKDLGGDEYSANVYAQYLGRLAEYLVDDTFAGHPIAIVPRISSPVCAMNFREELNFGDKYGFSIAFVDALMRGSEAEAVKNSRPLSDALMTLLADFTVNQRAPTDAERERIHAVLAQEPLRSRLECARQDPDAQANTQALASTAVQDYYRDAIEEFVLLALHDLDEVDDDEDEDDDDWDAD